MSVSTPTVTITRVDDVKGSTPGYGTFGSWDQHVVSNAANEIFVAYSYVDDQFHKPNYWRLARSRDAGQTFQVLYDGAADGSLACAPALEIDAYGNLYVIASTDQYGLAPTAPMLFYRFDAGADSASPQVASLLVGAPGKYSTVFDAQRNLIHILQWSWSRQAVPHPDFHSVTTRGLVVRSVNLFKPREAHPHAAPEYPCLALGADGQIIASWATMDDKLWSNGTGRQNYYDAHFIKSSDGGVTWQGPSGHLSLPIMGDDTGPAFTINDPTNPADTAVWGTPTYSGNWNVVHNVAVNQGALQFFYGGPYPSPHVPYGRLKDGTITRRTPFFTTDDGTRFSDAGGSFAQDQTGTGTLLFAGRYWHANNAYIGVAASDDGGMTWRTLASAPWPGPVRYINTARQPTASGALVGCFTGSPTTGGPTGVYFFRFDP